CARLPQLCEFRPPWFITCRSIALVPRFLDLEPPNHKTARRLRCVGATKLQILHLPLRLLIVQAVVPLDHVAAAVAEPAHQQQFRNALIRALATEEVPERVQAAILEPDLLLVGWKAG